jgi:CubicO group peptidase (beta-lactamase class C family)
LLEQRAVESVRLGKPTSASRSPAEPTDADRLSGSQAVLDQAVQGRAGLLGSVGRRGQILWTGGAGVSNLQRRDPITADTVFDAGSVSKQFTATAVLLLQQEGKLSVDDRLSRQVDGLPAWSDQVTLAQLMHLSGIPKTEDIQLNEGFQPQDRVKRATLRKAIAAGP